MPRRLRAMPVRPVRRAVTQPFPTHPMVRAVADSEAGARERGLVAAEFEHGEDVAVGWEALDQWGDDVARIEPLAGGVGVNQVWRVRVNGHLAVGRLGTRSDADLSWETDLLRHLDRAGMRVPVPIPTRHGRYFADGLVVMTYVDGGP